MVWVSRVGVRGACAGMGCTAVAAVQASFERNQIRPGDAGYVHDTRIAFDEPKEAVSAAPVRPVESD